mmetsp:Transcript_42316/g.48654  ORF Transcript_42316/g.48654 Transcript_42316/m.48654 type:complete len:83 (+) Transcript_42316:13-261(+)
MRNATTNSTSSTLLEKIQAYTTASKYIFTHFYAQGVIKKIHSQKEKLPSQSHYITIATQFVVTNPLLKGQVIMLHTIVIAHM